MRKYELTEEPVRAASLWIIRFSDGTMISHYGSRETAEVTAKARAKKNKLNYVIA